MKRYFEVIGEKTKNKKNKTLQMNIREGSKMETVGVETLSKATKQELREIDVEEYKRLNRLYEEN